MARWGMLGPPQYGGQNIRNVSSPHWRGWLGKDRRCIRSASVCMLVSSALSDTARAYEELPAHDPERMKGQSKPCWTPFPISTIIVSRTGVGPWTLGLGYEASDSANTRPHFGTTRSTRTCCRELTDDDLKELGVSALGDRKRLLKAIAESGSRGASLRNADESCRPSLGHGQSPSAARSP